MLLSEKSRPTANRPQEGALGGLWMNLVPAEIASALGANTGPGTPSDSGSPTLGTLKAGMIVCLDTNGNAVLMTSQDITANMPKLPFVVFSGDDNFHGAYVGNMPCYHGGARLDTDQFDAGTYTPGAPLIANAGKFAPKAAVADHIQVVGFVGPRGVQNGILDVMMPQGVCGY